MPTERSPRAERWFTALLVAGVLTQGATALLRPMLSYRALEIGVGPTFLGVVAATFALVPLVIALRLGRSIDRGNEAAFAVAGTLAMAGASVVLALVPTLPVLLLCSAVLGVGHLVLVVATQALVASASTTDRFDRRFAHVAFAASIGHLIGPALGGLIAGDGSSAGTSAALLAGGALALVALPFLLGMRGVSRPDGRPAGDPAPAVPLTTILRSPGMAATMVASLTVLSAVDMLMVYLPALGEAVGWSPATVGALLAVRAGASMVSRLGLGRLVDRFGRNNLLAGSMAVSAVAILAIALGGGLPIAFAVMIVSGLGLGMGQPLTVAAVAASAEPGTRGTALSVRMMGNRLGQVAVPIAAGLVAGVTGVAGVFAVTGLAVGVSAAVVAAGSGPPPRRGAAGATGVAPEG